MDSEHLKKADKYRVVSSIEYGAGQEGIKLLVAGFDDELLYKEELPYFSKILEDTVNALRMIREKHSEGSLASREENKRKLTDLFSQPIFVEEILNPYFGETYYGFTSPAICVTTCIGRIKIWYRKRVIEIDWTESLQTFCGEALFPAENVTKSDKYDKTRYIHADTLVKAKEYLNKIQDI